MSVTTIKGTDCKLAELGNIAASTGGQVSTRDLSVKIKIYYDITNDTSNSQFKKILRSQANRLLYCAGISLASVH